MQKGLHYMYCSASSVNVLFVVIFSSICDIELADTLTLHRASVRQIDVT